MMEQVGIIRNNEELKKMKKRLEKMLSYLRLNLARVKDYEVQNLITLAYLTVDAALIRKESRGAHYRSDFSQSKEKWAKHIILQRAKKWEELEVEFK